MRPLSEDFPVSDFWKVQPVSDNELSINWEEEQEE